MNTLLNPHARVFFALWPDAGQRAALADWQPLLRASCGGRVMRADSLHATLVFLGNVAVRRLEALQLAAQEVEAAAFSVTFDRAAYWGHNHIAYAATSTIPPELQALVASLQAALRRHRFRFEQREYLPHVTLLRHATWSDAPLPAMSGVTWPVSEFVLLQSMPQATAAHYQVLARFPLK
jgi:2'-5' RNA ligase